MYLIVGLGNPGEKYKNNRHNVGFIAIDMLCAKYGTDGFRQKFHGDYTQTDIDHKKVVLLKPQTFMNRSGISVAECAHFFKIPKENIIIIHDELALETGRIKVKKGGSNAGHNGLKSIDCHIGTEYVRIRFGISHPGDSRRVSDYVLSDFPNSDYAKVNASLKALVEYIGMLLEGDMPKFMNNCSTDLKNI